MNIYKVCGFVAERKESFSSHTSPCTDRRQKQQEHPSFFAPAFNILRSQRVWMDPEAEWAQQWRQGYSLFLTCVYSVLAQGRKFTAISERDIICGKTSLFSMKSSQAPRRSNQLATKGLLFSRHNVALDSTAWRTCKWQDSKRCADVRLELKEETHNMCVWDEWDGGGGVNA